MSGLAKEETLQTINKLLRKGIKTKHVVGTVTASYVPALRWECDELKEKTIHIFNTDAALTMMFKILARYSEEQTTGKEDVRQTEKTLGIGEDYTYYHETTVLELIVQVIDGTGHATYEINAVGRRL